MGGLRPRLDPSGNDAHETSAASPASAELAAEVDAPRLAAGAATPPHAAVNITIQAAPAGLVIRPRLTPADIVASSGGPVPGRRHTGAAGPPLSAVDVGQRRRAPSLPWPRGLTTRSPELPSAVSCAGAREPLGPLLQNHDELGRPYAGDLCPDGAEGERRPLQRLSVVIESRQLSPPISWRSAQRCPSGAIAVGARDALPQRPVHQWAGQARHLCHARAGVAAGHPRGDARRGGYELFMGSFALGDGEPLAAALTSFDVVRTAYLAGVLATDPGADMTTPPGPWDGTYGPVDSVQRFGLAHHVEEFARHAVPAAIIRAQIDGAHRGVAADGGRGQRLRAAMDGRDPEVGCRPPPGHGRVGRPNSAQATGQGDRKRRQAIVAVTAAGLVQAVRDSPAVLRPRASMSR